MYRSVIEIDGRDCDLVYQALMADMQSTERAKVKMTLKHGLKIEVLAEDVSALRAVLNTVLRQIKLIEDTIHVGENNDTGN